jgi:competence protein ComEC
VPITGFWIMPWAILSCLLMPLHLEYLPLQAMGWGIDLVAGIAHRVEALPSSVLHVPSMPAWGLALIAFGGLWLCVWMRRWRLLGLVPVVAGYASLLFVVPPDILVSSDGKLVALRAADGRYLPSVARRGADWTESIWTQRAAEELGPIWPASGDSADGRLRCTTTACTYRANDQTVAFVRDHAAVARECRQADLVISPVAAHLNCPGAPMIDSVDTWKRGGHAIWLTPSGIAIESVADWRGHRPWIQENVPKRLSSVAADRPADPEP